MWLRPRTEILPPDPRWWQFNDETKQSAMAVGFGLLNLAYLAAAMLSVVFACLHKQPQIRWVGLLITFVWSVAVSVVPAERWKTQNPGTRWSAAQ